MTQLVTRSKLSTYYYFCLNLRAKQMKFSFKNLFDWVNFLIIRILLFQNHSNAVNGGLFILLGALIEQECQDRVQKMIEEKMQNNSQKVTLAASEDIEETELKSIEAPKEVIVHSKC